MKAVHFSFLKFYNIFKEIFRLSSHLPLSIYIIIMLQSNMPYRYRDYTLHEKEVKLKGGGTHDIYFFSKGKPKSGHPTELPPGKEVGVNKRTGLPFLRNK